MADPKPWDAWQADGLHYFVFELRPEARLASDPPIPYALFTMRWEDDDPVSALVITPLASGEAAEVVNLHQPDKPYTVPLIDETKR